MKATQTIPFSKQKSLFFCDQGEFLGGAEYFLLDIIPRILEGNLRNFQGFLIGGSSPEYREILEKNSRLIQHIPFKYPSVRGNIFMKIIRVLGLAIGAGKFTRTIKKILAKSGQNQKNPRIFFTNTPRTHFLLFFAKKIFRIQGTWIIMIHDFTTPPKLINLMGKTADILIANSLPTRKFLHENLEKKDQLKVKLVENGVDLKLTKPENFQKIPDENRSDVDLSRRGNLQIQNILLLGRIDPKKGQYYLLEAADLLLERNPDLRFNIIGSATKTDQRTLDYENKCQKFHKKRKLHNVKFTPALSDPFPEIYKNDLVIALPTEPETFGRVVIEGLAMGKMVLSFDQTGPREILDHFLRYVEQKTGQNLHDQEGRNPLLITPNNSMDLAEKLGFLADHQEITEIFLPHAKNFAEENYSTQSTQKAMRKILEDL